jgi:hypothetical protein
MMHDHRHKAGFFLIENRRPYREATLWHVDSRNMPQKFWMGSTRDGRSKNGTIPLCCATFFVRSLPLTVQGFNANET